MTPGKRYVRYSQYSQEPGDIGKGSFLTDRRYGSAAEAKSALDLRGAPPRYEQIVEVVDVGQPVQGIKSGISKGAGDAVQIALPRPDVYRIVSQREIR